MTARLRLIATIIIQITGLQGLVSEELREQLTRTRHWLSYRQRAQHEPCTASLGRDLVPTAAFREHADLAARAILTDTMLNNAEVYDPT